MKTKLLLCVILSCALFSALAADSAPPLTIRWEKGMLKIKGDFPGETLDVWYLEAFCRSHSTHQAWDKTTIPHKTELMNADKDGRRVRLLTTFEHSSVVVEHEIVAGKDDITFNVVIQNYGNDFADVQWFQPCMRVDRFTGRKQNDYHQRCFIFTKDGLRFLDKIPRAEEAIYKGGQVYVPDDVPIEDVNPRPISSIKPANDLIGCVSADDKWLLATAWDDTQELFQGVIVCIHNDPRVGGLKPGEKKKLRGKIYIMPNDPDKLTRRYEGDFSRFAK
jgi:hypothetical protein